MLTEQSSSSDSAETVSLTLGTVPVGFIISDDGHALLAVIENEDGNLEVMSTPVAFIQPNNITASTKQTTENINEKQLFQLNIKNELTPITNTEIQQIETQKIEEEKEEENINLSDIETNEYIITEMLDDSVTLQDNEEPINLSPKKGPGRPKKDEEKDSPTKSILKCEICGEEFKKKNIYHKHMDHHAAEKPHRCPKCPASFNIPSNFTLHMATHSTGDTKCPECGKKFSRIASFKAHMMIHQKEDNLFCTECEDLFATKAQLDAHLKLHNEKWSTDDVRKCKLCNKQFTQPALYRLHIREHYRLQTKIMKQTKRGTKQKTIYKCKICNFKIFQKPSQLVRHLLVHTGEKPFKCSQCSRAFSQKSSLKIHMLRHIGLRPYACDQCDAKFSQKGNLNAHILRVHNIKEGEEKYSCTHCRCTFKKIGNLSGHIKKMHPHLAKESVDCDSSTEMTNDHSNITPDSNAITDNNNADSTDKESQKIIDNDILQQALKNSGLSVKKKSPQSSTTSTSTTTTKKSDGHTSYVTLVDRSPDGSLRNNITIKQRKIGGTRWYACSYCQKEFKKPSDLFRHRRVHTNEKPFKCTYINCNLSFALKSTMKAHERTHNSIKKYSCTMCDKTFSCTASLNSHIKTHLKPYKCEICNSSFSTNTVLKSHIKNHNKIKLIDDNINDDSLPKIILGEPLLISDTGDKISVEEIQSKKRHVHDIDDSIGRPHKCWICPAAFRKISHLKAHQRIHSGERPYQCNKCDRKFISNSVLKAHLNTHDETRPYPCPICNAKFSTHSSQKRHMVTHSNKRPFMCPHCHKTFKTTVNCRKHMKIHQNELAQKELEKLKNDDKIIILNEEEKKDIPDEILTNNLNLSDDISCNFQSNITSDFAQAFSDQYQAITHENKDTFLNDNNQQDNDNDNLTTTQTLHADETGTITLPNYSGDQSLTPESIREIEETLNQQLFNIGMNLGLDNNLSRQMNDSDSGIMEESREQSSLNIIYEDQKSLETSSAINQSIFGPSSHFDTFDMSQINLQTDTEIDMGISSENSTSMASILPRSAQEEQIFIPVTTCENNHQITSHMVDAVNQIQPSNEITSITNCQKYQKIIAKADTTDTSSFINQFISESDINTQINSPTINNIDKQSNNLNYLLDKKTLLQCHICYKKDFTADLLKIHLKTHKKKEFQCSECGQKCLTNGGLNRHIKTHKNKKINDKLSYDIFDNEEFKLQNNINWNNQEIDEPDSSQKSPIQLDNLLASNEQMINDEKQDDNYSKIKSTTKRQIKKIHKCNYSDCNKSFRKPSDLVRHVRTHTGERPFKCDYCTKSFAVKCTLDCHIRAHAGEKSFYCEICNNQFSTKGSLKVHLRLHTGSKPYKCTICDQRFRTSGHRKVHLISHTKDKNKDDKKAVIYNETMINNDLLNIDKSIEQQQENNVQIIDNTNDTLNTIINESQYQQQQQQQTTDYQSLDTITIDTNSLTNQLSFNNDGTIINNSNVLSVNDNNDFVTNLQLLLATGLVTLTTDDTILPNGINNLNEQQELVTNVIDQCNNIQIDNINTQLNDCITLEQLSQQSTTSYESTNLIDTTLTATTTATATTTVPLNQQNNKVNKNTKVPVKHECDYCGKTFKKPYLLQRHRRIHTNEKPFKCELCDKSFSQKSTLKIHGKHHTNDRPFKCEFCDNSFTQKCNLQTHLKRVHQIDTSEGKKSKRGQQLLSDKLTQDNYCQFNDNRILNFDDVSFVEFLKN